MHSAERITSGDIHGRLRYLQKEAGPLTAGSAPGEKSFSGPPARVDRQKKSLHQSGKTGAHLGSDMGLVWKFVVIHPDVFMYNMVRIIQSNSLTIPAVT
jgi:hypothetical protein